MSARVFVSSCCLFSARFRWYIFWSDQLVSETATWLCFRDAARLKNHQPLFTFRSTFSTNRRRDSEFQQLSESKHSRGAGASRYVHKEPRIPLVFCLFIDYFFTPHSKLVLHTWIPAATLLILVVIIYSVPWHINSVTTTMVPRTRAIQKAFEALDEDAINVPLPPTPRAERLDRQPLAEIEIGENEQAPIVLDIKLKQKKFSSKSKYRQKHSNPEILEDEYESSNSSAVEEARRELIAVYNDSMI